MNFEIGEAVGIEWEPRNREFEVYDRREILYKRSGTVEHEYQLCRIGKPEFKTDWINEYRLFKL